MRARGWAVVAAASGTVTIGAGAFWLSFVALADLAARSGIGGGQAWIWPLLVDGQIVVATVAVVALDGHRTAWYPWALLIAGALVSVTANAAHALVAADATVPGVLASVVAAVPPLVLLASTHLTVVLIRTTDTPEHLPPTAPRLPALTATAGVSTEPHAAPPPEPANELEPANGPEPARAGADAPETEEPAPSVVAGAGVRERAARLRAEGWSNKQIARELGVHPSTVGRWLPRPPVPVTGVPERARASAGPDGAGHPSDLTEEESS